MQNAIDILCFYIDDNGERNFYSSEALAQAAHKEEKAEHASLVEDGFLDSPFTAIVDSIPLTLFCEYYGREETLERFDRMFDSSQLQGRTAREVLDELIPEVV